MRTFSSAREAALHLWDYFYVANAPARGEQRSWATIERATCRILELVPDLDPGRRADERLVSALAIRRATGRIRAHLGRLLSPLPPWILDTVSALEQLATSVVTDTDRPSA